MNQDNPLTCPRCNSREFKFAEDRAAVLERYAQERDAAGDRDTAAAIRELAKLTAVIQEG